MAKAKHQAKKTKVNIGTIGHVDYGKTTLIDAIINAQFHNVGTEVKKHNQNQNLIPEIHIEIERGKEQKVATLAKPIKIARTTRMIIDFVLLIKPPKFIVNSLD